VNSSPPLRLDSEHGEEVNESELIKAAQANPVAFAEIYSRYVRRVYRYLRARVETDEDAADFTHRVFLQALDALPRYQEHGSPFAAWLFRISRNVAHDAHRRRRITVPWEVVPEALYPVDAQDCEHEVVRQEDIAQLKSLLATLDPEQRELIALRFDAELTLGEIARVIGTSQATVQRRMVRILQTLKEHYREQ